MLLQESGEVHINDDPPTNSTTFHNDAVHALMDVLQGESRFFVCTCRR